MASTVATIREFSSSHFRDERQYLSVARLPEMTANLLVHRGHNQVDLCDAGGAAPRESSPSSSEPNRPITGQRESNFPEGNSIGPASV